MVFKNINRFFFSIIFFSSVNIQYSYSQDTTNYKEPSNLDVSIFRAINNSRTNIFDKIIFITDKSILPVSILTPPILFTVSRINKNYYDENSSVLCALSEATSVAFTYGIKILVKRPRPFVVLKDVKRNKDDLAFTDPYSFPSNHTSTAFSIATSLTLRYPDKPLLITGLYLYSTVIALGRIYLGVHYPTDVLGGMLIGAGSAVLIHSLRKEIISGKNSLFNERGREDKNSNSNLSSLILLSFVTSDVVNYFLTNSDSKFLNKVRMDLSNSDYYKINLSYQF
ncbi:MAG TPA: phosphatase PAP2 family protein [Ignavibacteria bacterium]